MKKKLINTMTILLLLSNIPLKAQWQSLNLNKEQSAVQSMACFNNIIYSGVSSVGVLSSIDDGKTWQVQNNGITVEPTSTFPSIVSSGGKLLVLKNVDEKKSIIYESVDNGKSWTTAIEGLPIENTIIQALFVDGKGVYAGLRNGGGLYFKAIDAKSWSHVNFPEGNVIYDVRNITRKNETLFVITKNDGVYTSTDNGTSWQRKMNSGITLSETGSLNQLDMLAVKDNLLFTGGNHGLFVSENNGDTWTMISDKVVRSMVVQDTRIIIGVPSSKAYFSDDNGFTWTEMSEGLKNVTPQSFLLTNENLYACHASNGITKMSNNKTTSVKASIPDNRLKLFPNPASSFVNISFDLFASEDISLQVTDVTGKVVYSKIYSSLNKGVKSIIWSTDEISNGVYIIRVQQGNNIFSEKLTVNK